MNTQQQPDIKINHKDKKFFSTAKDFGMLFIGIISTAYLLNFTFGFIEFLPDALPFVGNVDEVLITGVLISVLQYFGIDITKWFKRK
jgi:hypothetical protein